MHASKMHALLETPITQPFPQISGNTRRHQRWQCRTRENVNSYLATNYRQRHTLHRVTRHRCGSDTTADSRAWRGCEVILLQKERPPKPIPSRHLVSRLASACACPNKHHSYSYSYSWRARHLVMSCVWSVWPRATSHSLSHQSDHFGRDGWTWAGRGQLARAFHARAGL